MAFCFKRKESVAKAVRRLGEERIEKALECLKDCERAEAIHCARKEIKKLRAVIRLVRSRIRKEDFKSIGNQLRKAAGHLAPPRDAQVKVQTFGKLLGDSAGDLGAGVFFSVRTSLQKACDKERKRFSNERTAKRVGRILRRVTKDVERLNVSGKGWNALRRGVNSAYSKGRQAHRIVTRNSSTENIHEWRKRAKDLWYQVKLLQPIWPGQLDATARELEALTEHLGNDHDLAVLRRTLEESGTGEDGDAEILKAVIDDRQRESRAVARSLGARFYAEKPSVFCNRLARRWEIWRAHKESAVPKLQKAA